MIPMRSAVALLVLHAAAGAAGAQDRESTPGNYASLVGLSISYPFGDARQFTSAPGWLGINWEGQWSVRRGGSLVVGALLGMHNFFERSDGTMDLPSGSATGEQARELTMVPMLAIGRWYTGGTRWRGVMLGLGVGAMWARQSFQLGVFDPIHHSAFHPAIVPEAGVTIPIFEGVKGMIGLRYSMAAPAGDYLGGGRRSFQFVTLTASVIEH